MLIFEMIITEGFEWDEDDQGNSFERPVERMLTLRASRETLGSLLRGIRRIIENRLADECYVMVKEHDARMSYIGAVFESVGLPGMGFDDMMKHQERALAYVLTRNGIEVPIPYQKGQ